MSVRVLLADDEQLIRAGFRLILESEPDFEVVGEAANGREAVDLTRKLDPDVVLMDIQMPEINGLEATRQIAALGRKESSRVLVLTTFEVDEYVYEALRAGASGFLLKDVHPAEFVQAIRIVAAGEALLAPSVTRRLIDRFARLTTPVDEARATERLHDLTERERESLTLVAQGLSNREIAERLSLAEPTVKTHVSHLLMKLGLRDRAQLVVLAYEVGLVRPGAAEAVER
jgi:DNA-binding NarL/FixJ family response regulator